MVFSIIYSQKIENYCYDISLRRKKEIRSDQDFDSDDSFKDTMPLSFLNTKQTLKKTHKFRKKLMVRPNLSEMMNKN